jgi:hypothetical protein
MALGPSIVCTPTSALGCPTPIPAVARMPGGVAGISVVLAGSPIFAAILTSGVEPKIPKDLAQNPL